MSRMERDELKLLKLPVLREILDMWDCEYDRKSKDIDYLINTILTHRRLLQAASGMAGMGIDGRPSMGVPTTSL